MTIKQKIIKIINLAEISDKKAANAIGMSYQVFKNYKGNSHVGEFSEAHYHKLAAHLSTLSDRLKEVISNIEINGLQETALETTHNNALNKKV